jgi:hypothetical protein
VLPTIRRRYCDDRSGVAGDDTLRLVADAASLIDGFHAFEPDNGIRWGIRWTDGDAAVPKDIRLSARHTPAQ